MPAAASGLFLIDFIARPFAKIYEKMPVVILLLLLLIYGVIAYFVLKGSFFGQPENRAPY